MEILKDGYADAFTQFFSLSHPPEPETDAAAAAPAAAPALDLATVKEKLMEALSAYAKRTRKCSGKSPALRPLALRLLLASLLRWDSLLRSKREAHIS